MKQVLALLLMWVMALGVQAQGEIKYGFTAGTNLSSVTGKNAAFTEEKFGFQAGTFLEYGISKSFSLRPEVLYSLKNWEGRHTPPLKYGLNYNVIGNEIVPGYIPADLDSDLVRYSLHVIDVPLLARFQPGRFFLEGGPVLGLLVHSNAETMQGNKKLKDAPFVQVGYAVGLGYELRNGLGFGVRYQGALTTVKDLNNRSLSISALQVSVSYALRK